MPYEFAPGLVVEVKPPFIPSVVMAPPSSLVDVVPVIGPQGPQGSPGPAGTSVNAGYHHVQAVASRTWHVTHQLGFHPAGFLVKDSVGDIIEVATVTYIDHDNLDIDVGFETSGTAKMS